MMDSFRWAPHEVLEGGECSCRVLEDGTRVYDLNCPVHSEELWAAFDELADAGALWGSPPEEAT